MTCVLCGNEARYECAICSDVFCKDCSEYHFRFFETNMRHEDLKLIKEEDPDAQTNR